MCNNQIIDFTISLKSAKINVIIIISPIQDHAPTTYTNTNKTNYKAKNKIKWFYKTDQREDARGI